MASVYIILVRRVNHPLLIGADSDVFHVEIAWGEKKRCASVDRNRIKMIPSLLFRIKNNEITGEVKRTVRRELRERILRPRTTVPKLISMSRRHVGNPDSPW